MKRPGRQPIFLITGTDTGVGKTVVACLIARVLGDHGTPVSGTKPIASGSRADAQCLRRCLGHGWSLDTINPWFFSAPLAPALAAARQGQRVGLPKVLQYLARIRTISNGATLIVEGAGGLLSPLGDNFDSRDLLRALRAIPIVVARNRLGAINQVLLAAAALSASERKRAQYWLIAPPRLNDVSRSNLEYLRRRLGRRTVVSIPWLGSQRIDQLEISPTLRQTILAAITQR